MLSSLKSMGAVKLRGFESGINSCGFSHIRIGRGGCCARRNSLAERPKAFLE